MERIDDSTDPNLPVPDDGDRDFHDPNEGTFDDVTGVLTSSKYTEIETSSREVAAVTTGDGNGQWVASDTFVTLVGDDEYDFTGV
ncbi:hypothetical protein PN419_00245 [Halorubrum ezzemoulense]|uniref:hypothetical protein n=1 Tax=Halorubrum ezzemoulense TaxID=337243 RepID=UPI00232EA22A|nr:hypothetical protein [Halorubrum ezzemoulense]MDB9247436.1 hypothetical protein [Halorubrum ezzemoulense]MDB9258655.1 hypothetical protein [Halorubrum ezzemoulense]MDB9264487.1 hypothetical protein [Halorubrum ezzemoulense]MDB9269016.1 hypothetical protein [Halorubrum ezzemoulense]MDB9271455.1 hypothetical protein [Halorubrum ezzemoulense]